MLANKFAKARVLLIFKFVHQTCCRRRFKREDLVGQRRQHKVGHGEEGRSLHDIVSVRLIWAKRSFPALRHFANYVRLLVNPETKDRSYTGRTAGQFSFRFNYPASETTAVHIDGVVSGVRGGADKLLQSRYTPEGSL
ncbi:MAG: hypothetical protein DMG39_29310, partial [Acidobacteria bacterium]